MSRVVRHPASFLGLAALLLGFPIAVRFVRPPAANPSEPVSPVIEVAMRRAGLTPEALASSGVDSNEAATVVSKFQGAFDTDPAALSNADQAYSKLRVETDVLRRKVQSGLASQEEIAALQTSTAQFEAAEAKREDLLDGLFAAATTGLAPGELATLQAIRANAHWSLPSEFLVAEREQGEWVKLRDALSNEKICAKYGDPVNPDLNDFLSSCRSEQPVSMAKNACDANLAAVKQALSSTMGD